VSQNTSSPCSLLHSILFLGLTKILSACVGLIFEKLFFFIKSSFSKTVLHEVIKGWGCYEEIEESGWEVSWNNWGVAQ